MGIRRLPRFFCTHSHSGTRHTNALLAQLNANIAPLICHIDTLHNVILCVLDKPISVGAVVFGWFLSVKGAKQPHDTLPDRVHL